MSKKDQPKRPTAGRPPFVDDPERHNIYIPSDVWKYLKAGVSASITVTQFVRQSPDYWDVLAGKSTPAVTRGK